MYKRQNPTDSCTACGTCCPRGALCICPKLDAGGGGGAGGLSCADLDNQYAAALPAAKSCAVGVSGQCQQLVSDALAISPCHIGCDMIYVNDASALNAIESTWTQAGCNLDVGCPNIACAAPTMGTCVAADGGGGVCKSVTVATPTN